MSIEEVVSARNKKAAELEARLLNNYIDAICESDAFERRKSPYDFEAFRGMTFRHVSGMTASAEDAPTELNSRISDALSGMHIAQGSPTRFAFLIVSDGTKCSFYIGAPASCQDRVYSAFEGALEDVRWSQNTFTHEDAIPRELDYGGVVTGMPMIPTEEEPWKCPVSMVFRGMHGNPFAIAVLCVQRSRQEIVQVLNENALQQSEADKDLNAQYGATEINRMSTSVTMYSVNRYLERLRGVESHLREAYDRGGWAVMTAYMAGSRMASESLAVLLCTGLSGHGAGPEPVRSTYIPHIRNWYIVNRTRDGLPATCCVPALDRDSILYSLLSSTQLATLVMLPREELPGFFVNDPVRFDITERPYDRGGKQITLGDVLLSMYSGRRVGQYRFLMQDLDRHALVVGTTGGGKSNTTRSLLLQLWRNGVPFLVIESAKSEYWALARLREFSGKLRALQLGSVESPFRINPFECVEGFPLQTHVDALLATFNTAFEMYAPMPFILERAVYQVYHEYGWDIATGTCAPRYRIDGGAVKRNYPTLMDLYLEIPKVVAATAYDAEVRNNVQGALQTRVRSLMTGGKGTMLNVRSSTPLKELLGSPTVLELENLGNDATKAFCIGLLMNSLYEYRRVMSAGESKPFSHLLVLEEAHRLLRNISEDSGNPQAAAVAFFCNMLSEIRSYGQGILIADQSPVKLSPDAIRNTNLKIVHRIVDVEDREAVGGAMHMDEAQIAALSSLSRGCAAVYAEGDHRPRLVQMELVVADARSVTRKDVLESSRRALVAESKRAEGSGCELCDGVGRDGSCGLIAARMKSQRAQNAFMENGRYRLRAQELLNQNGPDEELLYEIAHQALQLIGAWGERIDLALARLSLCTAGGLLKRLGIPEEQSEVGLKRLSMLLGNRME